MAYISTDVVALKRKQLKERFPDFTFSVRREHSSSINVAIMSSPHPLPFYRDRDLNIGMQVHPDGWTISEYHYESTFREDIHPNNAIWLPILKDFIAIVDEGNHDNSDVYTDYFDVGFYTHMSFGRWDRPYLKREV